MGELTTQPGVIVRVYRRLALWLLNLLIIFVVLNVALELTARLITQDTVAAQPAGQHEAWLASLELVYPDMDQEQTLALLQETWSRPFEYAAFTQFREQPYDGQYLHISPHGYRHGGQPLPWPPSEEALTVFVFGGSTTFGYGVSDGQTIPAHLQTLLQESSPAEVNVYNFGCGHYYSVQERILFETLLLEGFVPDVAVFIDGFNDYRLSAGPRFTEHLAATVEGVPLGSAATLEEPSAWEAWEWLPAVRLARRVFSRAQATDRGEPRVLEQAANVQQLPGLGPREIAESITTRYQRNKRQAEAVAREWGVETLFVMQPVPYHGYDLSQHLFTQNLADFAIVGVGYDYLAERLAQGLDLGTNFLWLGEMQREWKEPLYVDVGHYTSEMSRRIAARIATALAD